MITTVGKEFGEDFYREDIEIFPCDDLKAIDNLWVRASNGHFGFSIWEKYGSPISWGTDYGKFLVEQGWGRWDS